MKTIFRALMLGILMTAFAAVTVTTTFAQDPQAEKQALYKKYTDNYGGTIEQKKVALDVAKQYVEKYGANAEDKEQVDYFKATAIPALEKAIATVNAAKAQDALFTRFDTSVRGNNAADTFAAGKEILAQNPDHVDVMLVLASVGFDQAIQPTPVDTYNSDAINYAKTAIQKIEAGKPSITGDYGAISYAYRNDKFADGKSDALGSMNYLIGYIMYYRQNQKKEAIPYFYKSLQYNSPAKNNPVIYQIIGASYFDEAKRLSQQSEDLAKAAGDKDTDESKAAYAMAKGYADRAIDAYARAYKVAGNNPTTKKEYKDGLYKVLQDLFKFRYNGKTDTLDAYVATVMNKPIVDPATTVTPIIEDTPSTGAAASMSSTSNTTVDVAPETSKNAAAKPMMTATGSAAKPAATTKAPAKTPTKKPATKKKGTR